MLDRWLYWLLHANEHTEEELISLFPESEFRQATQTLVRIKNITEDKQMYDATEKARRDRQWALNAKLVEGEIKGKVEMIRTLEGLLGRTPTDESQLKTQELGELQRIANELQAQLRSRVG